MRLSLSEQPARSCATTNRNHFIFYFFILLSLLSESLTVGAQTDQCVDGETCDAALDPPPGPISTSVRFINKSQYRADIYWDDGAFGANTATIEAIDGEVSLNTFVGHAFFVTSYGIKEG
eukprot:15150332-Ditylum_brightwellii.AAC.1